MSRDMNGSLYFSYNQTHVFCTCLQFLSPGGNEIARGTKFDVPVSVRHHHKPNGQTLLFAQATCHGTLVYPLSKENSRMIRTLTIRGQELCTWPWLKWIRWLNKREDTKQLIHSIILVLLASVAYVFCLLLMCVCCLACVYRGRCEVIMFLSL